MKGELIREFRKKNGLKREYVARKLGISMKQLYNIEHNKLKYQPWDYTRTAICRFTGIDELTLFGEPEWNGGKPPRRTKNAQND